MEIPRMAARHGKRLMTLFLFCRRPSSRDSQKFQVSLGSEGCFVCPQKSVHGASSPEATPKSPRIHPPYRKGWESPRYATCHAQWAQWYLDGEIMRLCLIGSKGDFDSRSVLEFTPSNPPGAFRIRGVDSDLYLAMNAKGRLYGEKDRLNENTLFSEQSLVTLMQIHSLYSDVYGQLQDRFFIYLSVRWSHLGWHVGIKRSGKAKRATKTVYPKDQKAIQFEHLFPYPIPTRGGQVKAGAPLGEDFPPLAYIDEDSEI